MASLAVFCRIEFRIFELLLEEKAAVQKGEPPFLYFVSEADFGRLKKIYPGHNKADGTFEGVHFAPASFIEDGDPPWGVPLSAVSVSGSSGIFAEIEEARKEEA